jgi:Ala-tRNA(Pro) deacylase
MAEVYDNIIHLLKEHEVAYREYDHAPILSYEDAEREKARHDWEGTESKNVFLRGADGHYYVFATVQGQRVDFSGLKALLGTKLSLASGDEVKEVSGCVPGCVAPFGFASDITIVVDPGLFKQDAYLFSPGVTTKTVCLEPAELTRVFSALPNRVLTWPGRS